MQEPSTINDKSLTSQPYAVRHPADIGPENNHHVVRISEIHHQMAEGMVAKGHIDESEKSSGSNSEEKIEEVVDTDKGVPINPNIDDEEDHDFSVANREGNSELSDCGENTDRYGSGIGQLGNNRENSPGQVVKKGKKSMDTMTNALKRMKATREKVNRNKTKKRKLNDPLLTVEDKNLTEMSLLVETQCEESPFMCCICNLAFNTVNLFKEHSKSICLAELQNKEAYTFQCKNCNVHFRQAFTLVRHCQSRICKPRKKRQRATILKCELCGKTYPPRRRTDYTLHMMLHENNKPHVCEVCGKKFIRWTTLRNHKRIHTGEKPFKCDYCPLSFVTRKLTHNL